MRNFIFMIVAAMGLGVISCSHNNQQKECVAQGEEEIGCLCCGVEAPEDSIDIIE